jgi:hypothetical protein
VPPEFISYKIAPIDVKEMLWNDKAERHITCTNRPKLVPEEFRSQESQNRICPRDKTGKV